MVFTTEGDISSFLEKCRSHGIRFRNRLVALDGYRFNMRPVCDGGRG